MRPEIWGPYLWYILHIISFNYPKNPSYADKRIYHDFYVNFKDLIPCQNCRRHYNQHLHRHPIGPFLDSRQDLVKWVIQMHNVVNISLGKPTMTVQEVLMAYQMSSYAPPNYKPQQPIDNKEKWVKTRLLFWIILFGSLVGFRIYRNWNQSSLSYY